MSSGGAAPILITDPAQLESAVGLAVVLRGVVTQAKIPTLAGVDIESSSPDLRGQAATASGWLRKTVVTQEELDRELKEKGIFGYRGPGTFYRLVDADGWPVQVRPVPSRTP
ncbi:MAG TPA: hypothetical protein VKW04_00540 [Planctomycetota bacterium]|nr:hypothetical protein [Planctomycetota bacterium]